MLFHVNCTYESEHICDLADDLGTTRPDIISQTVPRTSLYIRNHAKDTETSGCQLMSISILGSFQRTSIDVHQRQSVNNTLTKNQYYLVLFKNPSNFCIVIAMSM